MSFYNKRDVHNWASWNGIVVTRKFEVESDNVSKPGIDHATKDRSIFRFG